MNHIDILLLRPKSSRFCSSTVLTCEMSRHSTGSLCPYRDKKNWSGERRRRDMMSTQSITPEMKQVYTKPSYWLKGSSTLCVMSCTTCIYVPWVCLCRRSWRCNPTETQPAVCGQGRTSHTGRLPPAAECACVSPSASCITHTQAHTHTICHLNTILNMTIFTSEFPIE